MTHSSEITSPKRYKDAGELTGKNPTKEFVEIKIPMPWGHISGKWYGPQYVRPILGLHECLENAGTFDTLVPLLDPDVAFLSIDLPGHGLSSRLPDGFAYHVIDNLLVIRMIMIHYNWDKISIIGHSMSGIIAFLFAASFPDITEMIISIDALKPHQRSMENTIKTQGSRFEETIKEPDSYDYDTLIDQLYHGFSNSVGKDRCKYLLARNIQQSVRNSKKFFICVDPRIKSYSVAPQDVVVEMAKRITVPHMFIKALNSTYFEEQNYDEVLNILRQKKNFVYVEVEGTHHLHLNNPEKIIKEINAFIKKNGPRRVVSSKL